MMPFTIFFIRPFS